MVQSQVFFAGMSKVSLSILIPVYNWDVSGLIESLDKQSSALSDEFSTEIIVVEDGSTEQFENVSTAERLPFVSYVYISRNQGRSILRNILLERATGEYVLFLDADMIPDDDRFLLRYYENIKAGYDIVCGGISYSLLSKVDDKYSFYLYKSKNTEAISAALRNKSPWRYFFTSNILIRRSIANAVKFDLRYAGYGFEDIDLAIRLSKSFDIYHIDNTCSHMGLMSKRQTFMKMRESIQNYMMLVSLHPEETQCNAIVIGAKILQLFPRKLLKVADVLLEKIFFLIPFNSVALLIFQLDKLVIFSQLCKTKKSR